MKIFNLIQRNPNINEKDVTYEIANLQRDEVKNLLSQDNVAGGIFGIECCRTTFSESIQFFCPPHFKTNWKPQQRNNIFEELNNKDKNVSYLTLQLQKSSIFPLEMDNTKSLWEIIKNITPEDINILYQVILLHRHDNWIEELEEEYDCYLNDNIQQPFENKFLRNLQININTKLDEIIRFEHRNLPIEEFNQKINENGFRMNVRLCLIGGTLKQRKKVIKQLEYELNEISYMNKWTVVNHFLNSDLINNIKSRKLSNVGKNKVFCESEVLPFLVTNNVVYIEKNEAIINNAVKEEIKISNIENITDLLPSNINNKSEIDIENLAKKFSKALKNIKELKKELICTNSIIGTTLIKLYFKLPKEIKYSELIKKSTLDDLKAHGGFKHLEISQSDRAEEFVVAIPNENRSVIFLKDYITNEEFNKFSKNAQLPVFIGLNDNTPIYKDISIAPHLLVAGSTGSGKSTWLNSILMTLLLTKTPKELIFYMIDIKRTELNCYERFPHVQKICYDTKESILLLKQLIQEMDRRNQLFAKRGVRDINEHNKKYNDKLPRIMLCIDEYAEVKKRESDVDDYIETLTAVSRSSGITVILATQRPSVNVVNGTIKGNMLGKIVFKCSNSHSYRTILDSNAKYKLLNKGDGIMSFPDEIDDQIRFQGSVISIEDEVDIIENIAKLMNDKKEIIELPTIEEVKEKTDLDRLKEVIANTGEVRVTKLRDILQINGNKLVGLMKQLTDEGWLEKGKSRQEGYKLIINEEELEKWRNNN